MKRVLLSLFIFGMVISVLHTNEFSIGGRVGVMFGFHNESSDITAESGLQLGSPSRSLFSPNFTIFGNYLLGNNVSLQAELNFLFNQGFIWNFPGGSAKLNYSSLDIPIMVKYDLIEVPVQIGILLGPNLSVPLGKINFSESEGNVSQNWEVDSDSPTFGICFGVVAGYLIGSGRLIGDLRFILDFTQLKGRYLNETAGVLTRRGLILSAGYVIPL